MYIEVFKLIKKSILYILVLSFGVLNACSTNDEENENIAPSNIQLETQQVNNEKDTRPNILVILADDLGYSDIGVFGGEINTPNIDALASAGMRFTNFHVHMACSPTRAMFLTGVDSHIVGYGTMTDEHTPETEGQPGYETFLNSRTETIPQLLRDTGYHTYITGKWDMGGRGNEALRPSNRGFEESWVLVEGSGSHYDSTGVFADLPTVTYAENGKNIDLPEDFYSSKTYVDKMIEYIDKHGDDDDPFFAYLSFTAPHWPLQAPAEFIDRYKGVYDKGYEGIRERRLQRMRDLGLLTEGQQPAEPHELIPAWQDLSPTHQKLEVRRMEIYAGMVEAMDYHTGRLLDYLRVTGKWDDTLIIFLSDNGAAGENPMDWRDFYYPWLEQSFDLSLDNMGLPGSYVWYGPAWAQVSSTPYKYSKMFPTEGGIRSPAIFVHPGQIPAGDSSNEYANVLDLPATLLDIAGINTENYNQGDVIPLQGVSMLGHLNNLSRPIHESDDYYGLALFGRRALIQDNWKLVWLNAPWGREGQWSLYNLDTDPAESQDLADSNSEKLADMTALWDKFVKDNGVIPIEKYDMGATNLLSHFEWLPPSMR